MLDLDLKVTIMIVTCFCSQNAATVCLESCAKTSVDIVQIYHSVTRLMAHVKMGVNQDTNRIFAINVIKETPRNDFVSKFKKKCIKWFNRAF